MKLLNFLNKPFIKGIVKSIPIVGDLFTNVLTETQHSPAGKLDKGEATISIIRIVILVGILYLVFSGKLDMEEAEGYKKYLNN